MKSARILLAGMFGLGLWAAEAHAQEPLTEDTEAAPVVTQRPEPTLSNWLTYRDKSYGGELGGPASSPTIGTELFVRSGPSLPMGSGVFPMALSTGWMIEGGGRVLFLNPALNGAWVVEASGSNNYNYAPVNGHDILVGGTSVTVHSLNRTFLNVGLGRDWCLATPMDGFAKWNFGIDAGGRYGTGEVAFYEIPNHSSLLSGAYVAMHTDLQIPYGCFIFEMGLRAEWAYTHSYELLPTPNDMQDANLLVNFGVRY